MKISDLIKLLEEEIKYGDCEVFIEGSNAIYMNPLPWYYDGGGDMLIDGKWYSTRFNKDKCGDRILHLSVKSFEYGSSEDEYYDDVLFKEIEFNDKWKENYEEAKERFQKECRKIK